MLGKFWIPAALFVSVMAFGSGCASSSSGGRAVDSGSSAGVGVVDSGARSEKAAEDHAMRRGADGGSEGQEQLMVREDGRPSWWFDGARESEGRVMICAESIGADLAEARERALEESLRLLRDRLGLGANESVPGFTVDRTWVWPIPHASGAARRYAGYVRASADL